MGDEQWGKLKDTELVTKAFSGNGEAAVEMMLRLKKSNECLAVVNIFLTLALLIVAVIQFFYR